MYSTGFEVQKFGLTLKIFFTPHLRKTKTVALLFTIVSNASRIKLMFWTIEMTGILNPSDFDDIDCFLIHKCQCIQNIKLTYP